MDTLDRLAWERALSAGVILGYFSKYSSPISRGNCESSSSQSDSVKEGIHALKLISRLLCQTHMSR